MSLKQCFLYSGWAYHSQVECGLLIVSDFALNALTLTVPPSVIGPNPENLTVVVNNFISLSCEVSGFPPPDLSWLKNEQPIKPNANALIVPGKELIALIRWAKRSHFPLFYIQMAFQLPNFSSICLFTLIASLYFLGAIRIRLCRLL